MSQINARRIALDCLRDWENGPSQRFADEILAGYDRKYRLEGPDRGLVQSLFYGVLRHLTRLDALIDELKRGKMSPENRRVLRIGLFQLFHTDIPEHAAVNETVALAHGMRGVVNGILRNAQRRREELEKLANGWPLATAFSHPEFLIERWEKHFGTEATRSLCAWNNDPAPVYARVNRLVPESEAVVAESSRTARVRNRPGFFRFNEGAPPHEWLDAGLIYVQDPSTALACDLLDPRPGETILDACAAPGGKAALLADRMKNRGQIVAADASPDRLGRVRGNLDRLRVTIAEPRTIDWLRPSKTQLQALPAFDAILIDVPCSNTGVMRRRADLRWRLRPGEFAELQRQQVAIVSACLPLLKPGGRIVYSTCSLEPEENREAVDLLLERFSGKLELEEIAESLPWRDGFDGAFAARLRSPR